MLYVRPLTTSGWSAARTTAPVPVAAPKAEATTSRIVTLAPAARG